MKDYEKMIAVAMALILLICSGKANATVPKTIVPLWDNIRNMTSIVILDRNDGTASATIIGKSETTCLC